MNDADLSTDRAHSQPAAFPEWGPAPANAPMRQGDVIGSVVGRSADLWHQTLVVITADCDLANSKHGGALTCVPIIPLSRYLLDFRHDKVRAQLVKKTSVAIADELEASNSGTKTLRITPGRISDWLAEEEVEAVETALGDVVVSERARTLMVALRKLRIQRAESIHEAATLTASCKLALGDIKDVEKGRTAAISEIASTLRSLPGDSLLLNAISASHSDGYVAYLRRVVEVNEDVVATSTYRLSPDTAYVRLSRLRAPYVYALTQQFASVFSAIGLPTEYEHGRDQIAELIRAGEY